MAGKVASAQVSLPAAKPPDGAALFKQQCATCHTTNLSDPPRQGPSLFKVDRPAGRQARGLPLFGRFRARPISPGTKARLDAWLTNPQAMIPGAVMAYRQAEARKRARAIIAYLKELN